MKKYLCLLAFALTLSGEAATKKAPAKKTSKARPPSRSQRNSSSSGADSVEGYIIRREGNKIIKTPKKQIFNFAGSEVDSSAQSPSQTVLGKRPSARPATLIPERQSFRNEFLESSGL